MAWANSVERLWIRVAEIGRGCPKVKSAEKGAESVERKEDSCAKAIGA
jgi:hypothetical protein